MARKVRAEQFPDLSNLKLAVLNTGRGYTYLYDRGKIKPGRYSEMLLITPIAFPEGAGVRFWVHADTVQKYSSTFSKDGDEYKLTRFEMGQELIGHGEEAGYRDVIIIEHSHVATGSTMRQRVRLVGRPEGSLFVEADDIVDPLHLVTVPPVRGRQKSSVFLKAAVVKDDTRPVLTAASQCPESGVTYSEDMLIPTVATDGHCLHIEYRPDDSIRPFAARHEAVADRVVFPFKEGYGTDGRFPDIWTVVHDVKARADASVRLHTAGLLDILKGAKAYAKDNANVIELRFDVSDPNNLTCEFFARSAERGDFSVQVAMHATGFRENRTLRLNVKYLEDAIKGLKHHDMIDLRMGTEAYNERWQKEKEQIVTPVLITPANNTYPDRIVVIMPVTK